VPYIESPTVLEYCILSIHQRFGASGFVSLHINSLGAMQHIDLRKQSPQPTTRIVGCNEHCRDTQVPKYLDHERPLGLPHIPAKWNRWHSIKLIKALELPSHRRHDDSIDRGTGTTLDRLEANRSQLRDQTIDNWHPRPVW
jgi:hypothetical protein